jgi:8-oxo-dGTP diphosphatase
VIKYVLGFCFSTDASQVVLIKKNAPELLKGLWNGVGGKIEPDESSMDAMVREFKEETGVESYPLNWTHTLLLHDTFSRYIIDVYRAFSWDLLSEVKTMTDEIIEIWDTDDALNSPLSLVYNLRWIIPIMLDPNVLKAEFHVI